MIEKLINNDFAYVAEMVMFIMHVKRFNTYGELAHRDLGRFMQVHALISMKINKIRWILYYGNSQTR